MMHIWCTPKLHYCNGAYNIDARNGAVATVDKVDVSPMDKSEADP